MRDYAHHVKERPPELLEAVQQVTQVLAAYLHKTTGETEIMLTDPDFPACLGWKS